MLESCSKTILLQLSSASDRKHRQLAWQRKTKQTHSLVPLTLKFMNGEVQFGHQEKAFHLESGCSGTGFPGEQSQHQDCQISRSIWTTPLVIWFNFKQSCRELDLMIFMGLLQLKIFYDSMNTQINFKRLREYHCSWTRVTSLHPHVTKNIGRMSSLPQLYKRPH